MYVCFMGEERALNTYFNLQAPNPPSDAAGATEQGSLCVGCDPHTEIKDCCSHTKINPHTSMWKREKRNVCTSME